MHSAIKKDGKPLYAYARSGAEVEREARPVRIYALEPTENRSDPADPLLGLIVRCSKGTYVRTLGEDIGAALGCGAHLASLRRIATGHLQLADAITLEALEAMDEVQRLRCLLPVERLFVPLPRIVLDGEHSERFAQGLSRRGRWSDAPCVAVFGPSPQALLGLGSVAAGVLQPSRLLSADDREQMQQQQSALASAGAPTESPHP